MNGAELVPLRTDFDVVWRGFDQAQVRHYVHAVEEELRLLTTDRDAAVARTEALVTQLEMLRTDNHRLRTRIDRICRTPIELDAVPERLGRMVELAHAEANEITHRAEAAAEQSWAAAREAATELRRRHERMLADLDTRRCEVETEHRELIAKARGRVQTMIQDAERRRRQLDEQAARHRQQVEHDFTIAMSERRAKAMGELTEQATVAKADAERVVEQARRQARRMVDEARREADALRDIRDRAAERIRAARDALAVAAPLLHPQTHAEVEKAEQKAAEPGEPRLDNPEPKKPGQKKADTAVSVTALPEVAVPAQAGRDTPVRTTPKPDPALRAST